MNNVEQRNAAIQEWLRAKDMADQWKAYERQMRDVVLRMTFTPKPNGGSETVDLGNGYSIAVTVPATIEVVNDEDGFVEKLEQLAETYPDEGRQVAETLVNWKPNVVKSVWDSLDDNTKNWLGVHMQTNIGTPQVRFNSPKV